MHLDIIRYKTEFGFSINDRAIIVDDIRVRGVATTGIKKDRALSKALTPAQQVQVKGDSMSCRTEDVSFLICLPLRLLAFTLKLGREIVRFSCSKIYYVDTSFSVLR